LCWNVDPRIVSWKLWHDLIVEKLFYLKIYFSIYYCFEVIIIIFIIIIVISNIRVTKYDTVKAKQRQELKQYTFKTSESCFDTSRNVKYRTISNLYVMQSRTTTVIYSYLKTSVFISYYSRCSFFVSRFLSLFPSFCALIQCCATFLHSRHTKYCRRVMAAHQPHFAYCGVGGDGLWHW
jgi:hypothetical protein